MYITCDTSQYEKRDTRICIICVELVTRMFIQEDSALKQVHDQYRENKGN